MRAGLAKLAEDPPLKTADTPRQAALREELEKKLRERRGDEYVDGLRGFLDAEWEWMKLVYLDEV